MASGAAKSKAVEPLDETDARTTSKSRRETKPVRSNFRRRT
jgi:hypothetical protein